MQIYLKIPVHLLQFLHLWGVLLEASEASAVVPIRQGVLWRSSLGAAWLWAPGKLTPTQRKLLPTGAWTLYCLTWEGIDIQMPP